MMNEDDEDRGFDLLYALSLEQRQQAIIHDVAPPDFVTRVVTRLGHEELPGDHELGFDHYVISDHDRDMLKWIRTEAKGLPGAAMSFSQFEKFKMLIAGYVNRLPEEPAAKHLARLNGWGMESFTFAWAGQPERGKPHYYRIQSQSFLIEYDDTQNNANHIHSVWRDFNGDFGLDLLQQHYQTSHK